MVRRPYRPEREAEERRTGQIAWAVWLGPTGRGATEANDWMRIAGGLTAKFVEAVHAVIAAISVALYVELCETELDSLVGSRRASSRVC